jgi:capsid protein
MAKAYETLRNMGVITDEQICAELGNDWQDVMEQRAQEREHRKSLGLPETDAASVANDSLGDKLAAADDA